MEKLKCPKCSEKLNSIVKTPHIINVDDKYATCTNCGKNQAYK
jgi:uncharacterized Zn finger protein